MDSINDQSQASTTTSQPEPVTPEEPTYKVYRPPKPTISTPQQDVPEAYFEHTKNDLRRAQDSLHARTEGLVNAAFRTRELRELAEKSKLAKYPTATIRIKFSDRTQLEKAFASTDKIKVVYAFVRSLLKEDVKAVKFILYQTPPPRELKVSDPQVRDATLLQLQLAPTALLHVKFPDESLNHNNVEAPLDPAVMMQAIDLPTPAAAEEPDEAGSNISAGMTLGSSAKSPSAKEESPKTVADKQKKLNKFFKNLGHKS